MKDNHKIKTLTLLRTILVLLVLLIICITIYLLLPTK